MAAVTGASRQFHPLLRFYAGCDLLASADEIAAQGYGGVVAVVGDSEKVKAISDFARECRKANLEFWLDISLFQIGAREDLRRWELYFDGDKPRFERSVITRFDPFNSDSAPHVIEALEQIPTEAFSGVFYSFDWNITHNTLFPPFPWSPLLSDTFDASKLAALVTSGPDAAHVRQEFWQALQRLLDNPDKKTFLHDLREWASQRDIAFLWRDERPELQALNLVDSLRVRLESAHHIADASPSYPWQSRSQPPNEMPRHIYSLLQAGAARFQFQDSPSLCSTGARLRNEIIARSAKSIATGHNAARIGVLFPTRSCRTHYHPDGHRFTRWVGEDLELITTLLDELHFDWMFIEEETLLASRQDESALLIGHEDHTLEMIIVPSITAVGRDVWERLEDFVESGGKVACLGLLPRWSEKGRDQEFEEHIGKATLSVVADFYEAYAALEENRELPPTIGYPVFREHASGGRLCIYQPRLNPDADDARLRVHQILRESLTPDLETQTLEARYTHRFDGNTDDASETFFIFNSGDQARRVNSWLRSPRRDLAGATRIFELDPATGIEEEVYVWLPYPPEEGGGIGLSLDLAPGESRFVRFEFAPDSTSYIPHSIERATFEVESFDGRIAHGYQTQSGIARFAARYEGKLHWHEGEMVEVPPPILVDDDWQEHKQEDFDSDPFFFTRGLSGHSCHIEIPSGWRACRVWVEVATPPSAAQLLLNEDDCGLRLASPFRFEVSGHVRFGETNRIMLRVFDSVEDEYSPLARLVAYPRVAVHMEEAPTQNG